MGGRSLRRALFLSGVWCYSMKEHWCTRFVLLTYISPMMCTTVPLYGSLINLSNESNSTSAVATSMSPKGRTEPSLEDAAQASAPLAIHSRT
jgi:hypothetical protein